MNSPKEHFCEHIPPPPVFDIQFKTILSLNLRFGVFFLNAINRKKHFLKKWIRKQLSGAYVVIVAMKRYCFQSGSMRPKFCFAKSVLTWKRVMRSCTPSYITMEVCFFFYSFPVYKTWNHFWSSTLSGFFFQNVHELTTIHVLSINTEQPNSTWFTA